MRSLAAEAGCALGLPYTVFTDRRELVLEIVRAELARLTAAADELVERAGRRTVSGNLTWYAELILDSPAVAFAPDVMGDDTLAEAFAAGVHASATGPGVFEAALAGYLAAEKAAGRVAADVDEEAFGFLLAGAIHNLVVSGPAYPRPSRRQLRQRLDAIAARLHC
jgi:AcrR family transcriptional regulator